MISEVKNICTHQQQYNTNGKVFSMSLSSNCIPCYLELYAQMYTKQNIQIHQMKVFDMCIWKRGAKRLQRFRQCYDLNPHCEKLGIECDSKMHQLNLSKEVPVIYNKSKNKTRFNSYVCFPKYKGEGDSIYKQNIALKRKFIQRSFRKTCNYLNFEGYCPQCDISFSNKSEFAYHLDKHIGKENDWGN